MKKLFFILFIISALILGVGCTLDGEEKSAEVNLEITKETTKENIDEKILIYVSGPEEMLNKLEIAFEEEHGDVCDMLKMSCG